MDLGGLVDGLQQVGLSVGVGSDVWQGVLGAVLMVAAALLRLYVARKAGTEKG